MDQAANLRKLAGNRSGASRLTVLDPFEPEQEPLPESPVEEEIEENPQVGTRVISVTSGKGGVGKTTLSVNMAITMARTGKKVLVFDGDLGLANINVLLGIIPEHNIFEVMLGKKNIRDIILPTSYGIDILAGGNGIAQLANLTDDQRNLFLEQLSELTDYDILIIDTGAGISANVVGLVTHADDIIIVTTPEPTAITDAYGMIKSIVAGHKHANIRLIVNRVASAIEAKRVADRLIGISEQFLRTRIENLGLIFEESLVQKSIRNQRPHVVLHPTSKSAACMNHIASRLLDKPIVEDRPGINGFFKKFIHSVFGSEKKSGFN